MLDSTYRAPTYPLLTREQWEQELYPNGDHLRSGMVERRLSRIHDTGYPIIGQELLNELVSFINQRTVLEVGAGSGYLSRLLHDRGISIRAIDHRKGPFTRPPWWEQSLYFDVENQDALTMDEFPADIVLMTWPCMRTTFSEHVASKLKWGQVLLYQGEGKGGCTGTNEFFQLLANPLKFSRLDIEAIEETEITQSTWYDHWQAYVSRQRNL